MAILKRDEKNTKLKKFCYEKMKFAVGLISGNLLLIIVILSFLKDELCPVIKFIITILIFYYVSIYIYHKYNKGFIKYIEKRFDEKKETLLIVAKDKHKNLKRRLFPSVDGDVIGLLAYLNLRWGRDNYSILYTDSTFKIVEAIQNKKVKNVYFYGHGSRGYFENYGIAFDYDLLKFVDHKKDIVIQLTCCDDEQRGCATDYLLEGDSKEKYQAGTVINKIGRDFLIFYKKDLVENKEYKDEKSAGEAIKKESKNIKISK